MGTARLDRAWLLDLRTYGRSQDARGVTVLSLMFPSRANLVDNTEDRMWTSVGGFQRTRAGVEVNEESALMQSAVFRCSRLLAEPPSGLPLRCFKRKDRDRELASIDDVPAIEHVSFASNPDMTAGIFREGRVLHQVNWGNGFAEISRDRYGRVQALWPIHPSRVTPATAGSGYAYAVRNNDGSVTGLKREDVLHVCGALSSDGIWGCGVIRLARENIGGALAVEKHGAVYFGSGAQPKGIAIVPGSWTPTTKAQFLREWQEAMTSSESARVVVLPKDSNYIANDISNEDNQFVMCCVPETLVTLADGSRKRVDELTLNDWVFGWDESSEKLVPSRVEAIADNGVNPLIKITTNRGRQLITTRNHPYLAGKLARCKKCNRFHGDVKKGLVSKWIAVEELKCGDYVRVGLRHQSTEAIAITHDEAWFVGAMVGDGCCGRTVSFTNSDSGILEAAQSFSKSIGMRMKKIPNHQYGWSFTGGAIQQWRRRVGSHMARLLDKYELSGKLSYDKRVPGRIMKSTPEAKAAFLSGYFDTDGCVLRSGTKQPLAYLASVSKGLLEDCQELLASLGIQSKIRLHHHGERTSIIRETGREIRSKADLYNLYVCGKSEIVKLANVLSLRSAQKRERLEAWATRVKKDSSREHQDFFEYDRIVSVEELPAGRTIALTIAGTSSHVTNGLITHNTQVRNQNIICNWYGVPTYMLGERALGGSLEALSAEYILYSLYPWVSRFEQQLNFKLLDRSQWQEFYFEHDFAALLRGDIQARLNAYRVGICSGIYTINECRRFENLASIGPAGDVHYVPANLFTAEQMRNGNPSGNGNGPGSDHSGAPADNPLDHMPQASMLIHDMPQLIHDREAVFETWRRDQPKMVADEVARQIKDFQSQMENRQPVNYREPAKEALVDVLGRMFTKESGAAAHAAKAKGNGDFDRWLHEFYAKHEGLMCNALKTACWAISLAGVKKWEKPAELAAWLRARSVEALRASYDSDTPEVFARKLADWPTKRADCVAEEVLRG